MRIRIVFTVLLPFVAFSVFAQTPKKPTASEIYHDIQKLNFLGSALYVAAHPDDENTRLISYLSNDVKARTAYLSLTRGDGGQNLVGPELREQLGVIRTQELLAARSVDGGEQFFTRANDFGYSKHPDETLKIWNEKEVLGDVVKAIRKFKPDVIINRFDHRTPGRTHGHHTSSAMLSVAAFDIVNDPSKYPAITEKYGTWKPARQFFNTSWWFYGSQENFEKADKSKMAAVETGNYYPSLGYSNGEIAALSRSMHKSQGFGSTGSRGSDLEYLELLNGEMPKNKSDLFEGINTEWSRLQGGEPIGNILNAIEENFNFKDPSVHVPQLMEAYKLLEALPDSHWKTIKSKELRTVIAECAGLFLEAVADQQSVAPKGEVVVTTEAINRSGVSMNVHAINSPVISFPATFVATPLKFNVPYNQQSTEYTFSATHYSTPYWLQEEGSLGMYTVTDENLIGLPERQMPFPVRFQMDILGTPITFERNIVYKFNDPVKGEVYQPFEVLPIATSKIAEKVIIFSDAKSREIPVVVRAGKDGISGNVSLQHPEGWTVEPAEQSFEIAMKGGTQTLVFKVTPTVNRSEGYLRPLVHVGDFFGDKELVTIDYDHIPYQNILLPSQAKVVRIPIKKRGNAIGYIEGAGDAVPECLEQIGYQVTKITPDEIELNTLQNFDAVVVGIRAYNVHPEMEFKQNLLNQYVEQGGTVIVQYNTSRGLKTNNLAPYSIELSRDRVTDEYAKVSMLRKDHPALNTPNQITDTDFDGWVQERGLYFPDTWDNHFKAILGMNDPGESRKEGSLLIASYGKGHYVYTGLSFFRELPAGVSGAYRLFANLLSLGN